MRTHLASRRLSRRIHGPGRIHHLALALAPLLAAVQATATLEPQATPPRVGPSGVPMAELGAKLLERAAAERPSDSSDLRERLAALHERVVIGGFEVWLPKHALDANGRWTNPRSPRGTARLVGALAHLQSAWSTRLAPDDESAASPSYDELVRWAQAWKPGSRPPTNERLVRAQAQLFERIHGRGREELRFGHVIVLAPTRAQLVALAGAQALLDPRHEPWLDAPWLPRCSEYVLPRGVIVIATSGAPGDAGSGALTDGALDATAVLETSIHRASHALTNARHRSAPHWWREGVAVYDTLTVLGADETVCSGAADPSDLAALAPAVDWLGFQSRFKSPYRGSGAANFFLEPLRRAWSADGFELVDLDTNRASVRAPAPSLGEGVDAPSVVKHAPPGVRKCYAEFQRAYATAFVHFLDGDGSATSPSSLQLLSRALARESRAELGRATSFHGLSLRATARSIGDSRDPAKDHEGAFLAWLTR